MRIEEIVLSVSNCDAAMEDLPEELKEEEIKLRDEALAARRKKKLKDKRIQDAILWILLM